MNNFKIRIIDFYKDVDKPIINNIYNDNDGKDVLKLSTIINFPLLKKDKDSWKIKDKNKMLKEIDTVKKKKIKEIKSNINNLEKVKISDIKESNIKILTEIESIDTLKKNLETGDLYDKIKNLSLLSGGGKINKKYKKIENNNEDEFSIKIIDIEKTNKNISDNSEDFIEIFSN